MKATIGDITPIHIIRATQLINKTNQFNLRTQRYTEAEINSFSNNSTRFKLIQITLNDRFSSYGLISCVILEKFSNIAFIDTWVMSCRVFKRGIEYLALEKIIQVADQWECDVIMGEYLLSSKNTFVKDLYADLGLVRDEKIIVKDKVFEGVIYTQSTTSEQLRTQHYIST